MSEVKELVIKDSIKNHIDIDENREEWDYSLEDLSEARNNNEYIVISQEDNRVYEVSQAEFEKIEQSRNQELEDTLKYKIRDYDERRKELDKEWESLHDLKPKDMDELDFQRLIQKARYETNPKNLDNEMINSFVRQDPIKVKEWIHKGADKFKLYDYVEKIDGKDLTMVQGWILEDLHNIKQEKHFPYKYDKEISDSRTITTKEFNRLFEKFENNKEFTNEELDCFLIKNDDGSYTAVDNTEGELYTEDFSSLKNALRYLEGESIDKLLKEETRYKVAIYETKDDYEQGEPFQYELFSNLEEAEKELNRVMKKTNYYSGFVLDRKTGIEEYAYYSDEKLKDDEESEEDEL